MAYTEGHYHKNAVDRALDGQCSLYYLYVYIHNWWCSHEETNNIHVYVGLCMHVIVQHDQNSCQATVIIRVLAFVYNMVWPGHLIIADKYVKIPEQAIHCWR